MKRYGLLVLALIGTGCVKTIVDPGPPKMGQTVARPSPDEQAIAADRGLITCSRLRICRRQ